MSKYTLNERHLIYKAALRWFKKTNDFMCKCILICTQDYVWHEHTDWDDLQYLTEHFPEFVATKPNHIHFLSIWFKSGAERLAAIEWCVEITSPHILWKTKDKDKPEGICDRNGEVVLHQCKRCGKAESELSELCNHTLPSREKFEHELKFRGSWPYKEASLHLWPELTHPDRLKDNSTLNAQHKLTSNH